MHKIIVALGALTALAAWAPASRAADDYIDTVDDVAAVLPTAKSAKVRVAGPGIFVALAARAPAIETLVVSYPGSAYDSPAVKALTRFRALRSLTITGDLFLNDADCEVLGGLSGLRGLNLHMP